MKWRIILFLCALALVEFLPRAMAEPFNRVVAVVNNDVITLHELNNKIREVTGLNAEELRSKNEATFPDTQRQVLELLIDERVAQEKIRQLGIKVSDRQVEDTIQRIKRDNQWTQEDLMLRLEKEGITFEKYKQNLKRDLERFQLINSEVKSKIIIREERIASYYREHRNEFGSEEKVHLAGIFLVQGNSDDKEKLRDMTARGEAILSRLRKGEDFGALAGQLSEGPGASEGGDLGVFNMVQLEPELREIIEKMPEGAVSDLIMRPNGVHILKLVKKQEAKVKALEDVRDAIYSILYKEEVDRRYMAWIEELRNSSFTRITF